MYWAVSSSGIAETVSYKDNYAGWYHMYIIKEHSLSLLWAFGVNFEETFLSTRCALTAHAVMKVLGNIVMT